MDVDARVAEGKRLIEQGQRLTEESRQVRPFFCRTCGAEQRGTHVPVGWYQLSRAAGAEVKAHRLGIYCSLDCLERQLPRLYSVANRLADRWLDATESYRQK